MPFPDLFIFISSIAAAAKSLQSCPTLCDPIDGRPPGSPVPGILQARVGCHFLLQCMKVRSESEVAQSCPTLSDPMDWSPPGSSVHGIFQARVLENSFISDVCSFPFFFFFSILHPKTKKPTNLKCCILEFILKNGSESQTIRPRETANMTLLASGESFITSN